MVKDNNKVIELSAIERKLIYLIKKSLKKVYKNDKYLLDHAKETINEYDYVAERSLVFRFGCYFESLIRKDIDFKEYHLDSEYNRNENYKKMMMGHAVIPDMILHKRGNNDNNFLIVEFKGHWNKDTENDYSKLEYFTSSESKYKYRIGLFIKLTKDIKDLELKMFQNGKKVGCI